MEVRPKGRPERCDGSAGGSCGAVSRWERWVMAASGGLLERESVLDAVGSLLEKVRAGQGGSLFVLGEAGLGKTAVLSHACGLAADAGMGTGLGRGNPMEIALPFGLLAQALDGVGARGLLGEDQIGSAAGDDRPARFYGVLRWLENHTGDPVLLALEDLHWADADTLALTSFIGRRISSLPVAIIGSLRPWPAGVHDAVMGLVHEGRASAEHLAPLSAAAAGALLADRLGYVPPADVARRAFTFCAGNPLLLQQTAMAIGQGEEIPDAPGAAAGRFGEDLLLARFASIPPAGMRCAQAAAVLGTHFQLEVAARVAGLDGADLDVAADALGRSGLIQQRSGQDADFVHPLFRQALYDDLAGPMRARLHTRAFAVLAERGMDAQAAEHAVAANLVGDAEAVAVLERAGRTARRSGGMATAVRNLDAAAALAGDRASHELLLARAEALLTGASPDRAVPAYEQLLNRPGLPAGARVEALWMLGRALVMAGAHDRARAAFDEAATASLTDDPGTAAEVLLDAAFSSWLTAGPVQALPLASRAVTIAAAAGSEIQERAKADWGQIALQSGDPAGMAAAEVAAPWLRSGFGPHAADLHGSWGPVNSFAFSACLAERLADSDRAFSAVRASVNPPEAVAVLANGHSYTLTRMGRLGEALDVINLSLSLADLVPLMQSFAGVGRAYIQLYRGELDDSAEWCKRVEAAATERGEWLALIFLWDVLGHRCLREGVAARACEYYAQLEATVNEMGIGEPCLPAWARHGISAYLAADRVSDAERVVAWLDAHAGQLSCRFPRIAAATGRAQLEELRGHRDKADAFFRSALALHDEVDLPLEEVETRLAYGAFLRRSGQPVRARPLLAKAALAAEAAGARWLAGLAREELRVAGGRRRRPAEPGALTAQEQRVADLAATGASNAEIARQLYLSVSTIETHLERIYTKLGIHSRRDLIAMAVSGTPEIKD
jgi:DNA-binding NarL/FixJ family response regulator